MKTKYILASLGAAVLMLGTAGQVAAANINLSIRGNGTESKNRFVISIVRTNTTTQTNETDIDNDIKQTGDTGHNDLKDNTGPVENGSNAEFSITTGKVDNGLDIDNWGGTNVSADPCDCVEGNGDVTGVIEGNGSHSDSKAKVETEDEEETEQSNDTEVDNDVDQHADTGKNDSEDNTGHGSFRVNTGTILNRLNIVNRGDVNTRGVLPQ